MENPIATDTQNLLNALAAQAGRWVGSAGLPQIDLESHVRELIALGFNVHLVEYDGIAGYFAGLNPPGALLAPAGDATTVVATGPLDAATPSAEATPAATATTQDGGSDTQTVPTPSAPSEPVPNDWTQTATTPAPVADNGTATVADTAASTETTVASGAETSSPDAGIEALFAALSADDKAKLSALVNAPQ